jgi:protoporphyrinogen oxidase
VDGLEDLAGMDRPSKEEDSVIDYGILGAGPAGLSMSMFLNGSSEVLEADDHPGGHASSFFEQGFTFDFGPHIMFSKNKPVLQFMVDTLEGNVHECRRKNVVSFRNRLVKYPFENALSSLPLEDNLACLKGYVYNPYKERFPNPANLREWLLATFGDGICERYLFPYNEKVWNIPVEDLSMLWAERIPNPNPDDILKSAIGYETEGYLHQLYYHYPRRGGYQAISEAWAKRAPVTYGFRVQSLERRGDSWLVSDGAQTREYRQLVSTLPVQYLATITNLEMPDEVRAAIDGLIVNPMFIISLGIRGIDAEQYTAIYFPEPEFLVNRVSFPATFSPENAPPGAYSVQAEITCKKNSATWAMPDEAILDHVIDGLADRGIIASRDAVIYRNVQRKTYSYVVYDRHYAENTRIIREWFPRHGLHLAGRFGFFEYANVDGILIRNLEIASQLNGRPVSVSGGSVVR